MESELREGYKMTELGVLPREWEVVKLGQISQTITKGTTPTTYGHSYVENGIPFLRVENITENANINLNDVKYISYKTHDFLNRSKLEEGDILFSIAGAIGRCALVNSKILPANINQAVSLIRFKNKTQLNPDFILQMLSSNKIKKQTELESTSLAQTNLNLEQVKNISIPLPPLPEQRRIATILSTLDETVEHTEVLIDKYKNIKAGLMADLLTRGIDEEGRIRSEGTHRFKDSALGRVPEEWEVNDLSNYCDVILSNVDKKTSPDEVPVFLCNYLDVFNNEYITQNIEFMKASAKITEVEKYSIKKGDVIITKDSETAEEIASTTTVIDDLNGVLCGYHLSIIRSKKDKFNGIFLSKLLNVPEIHRHFVTSAKGVTRYGLGKDAIKDALIPLPPLPEQRRIAEILTAADQRIEKEEAYRDKLLQLKKGLMQDLLTGKVRVKDSSVQMAEQSEN